MRLACAVPLAVAADDAWRALSALPPARGSAAGYEGTAVVEEADDDERVATLRLHGAAGSATLVATVRVAVAAAAPDVSAGPVGVASRDGTADVGAGPVGVASPRLTADVRAGPVGVASPDVTADVRAVPVGVASPDVSAGPGGVASLDVIADVRAGPGGAPPDAAEMDAALGRLATTLAYALATARRPRRAWDLAPPPTPTPTAAAWDAPSPPPGPAPRAPIAATARLAPAPRAPIAATARLAHAPEVLTPLPSDVRHPDALAEVLPPAPDDRARWVRIGLAAAAGLAAVRILRGRR